MNQLLIGVDVDEVLADFIGSCIKISPPLKALVESPANVFYHDRFQSLPPGEEKVIWDFIEANRGFVRSLSMFEGVQDFINSLRSLGTVIAVTSPASFPATWGHEREHWLREELDFNRRHIIQAPGKEFADVDVLIEDNPENLRRWYEHRVQRMARTSMRQEDAMGLYHGVLYVDGRYKVPANLNIEYTVCDSYTKIINAVAQFKAVL